MTTGIAALGLAGSAGLAALLGLHQAGATPAGSAATGGATSTSVTTQDQTSSTTGQNDPRGGLQAPAGPPGNSTTAGSVTSGGS